jgi:hypothetical protein
MGVGMPGAVPGAQSIGRSRWRSSLWAGAFHSPKAHAHTRPAASARADEEVVVEVEVVVVVTTLDSWTRRTAVCRRAGRRSSSSSG